MLHLRSAFISLMILAVSSVCASGQKPAAQTSAPQPSPIDAVKGIVNAFKRHPIVIIGERHGLRQAGDFYIKLVQDRSFDETVRNIVIEFASRQNQPLLDKYVAGERLSIEQLRSIWRDTTKVGSWESPIYAEWLAAIREVNWKLPADHRLRVLAGDTSVDWNRIQKHDDWVALGDNNISIADVILNQVLKKKQSALVVLGSNHMMKSGDRNGGPNVTTRLEAKYRGSTYAVLTLNARTFDPFVEDQLKLPNADAATLYELEETSAASLRDQAGAPLIKKADALLYLMSRGAFTEVVYPPSSFEPAYVKELDRRSMIEWGELRIRKILGLPPQ
jgi:Haem-binding uptake, Tiki superfamily, ChaN